MSRIKDEEKKNGKKKKKDQRGGKKDSKEKNEEKKEEPNADNEDDYQLEANSELEGKIPICTHPGREDTQLRKLIMALKSAWNG